MDHVKCTVCCVCRQSAHRDHPTRPCPCPVDCGLRVSPLHPILLICWDYGILGVDWPSDLIGPKSRIGGRLRSAIKSPAIDI